MKGGGSIPLMYWRMYADVIKKYASKYPKVKVAMYIGQL